MNRLQKIQTESLKEKAAALLNRKPSQILKVTEHYNGATVKCSNGNQLNIPFEVWVG